MKETSYNIRITEEEDALLDRQHSEHIEAYTNIHTQRISPHISNFYTRPISSEEKCLNITRTIAPGSSRISKKVMVKLIRNAVTMLTKTCSSASYFPSAFKKGIIRLIPKEYKPIKKNPQLHTHNST